MDSSYRSPSPNNLKERFESCQINGRPLEGKYAGWRPNSPGSQAQDSDDSSGIEDDVSTSVSASSDTTDDISEEDHLVETIEEFLKEMNRLLPLTINEQDIRLRVKQFQDSKHNNSSYEEFQLIRDLVKQKDIPAESPTDRLTSLGLATQEKKEYENKIKDKVDHGQQDTSSEKIDASFNCPGSLSQSFDEDEELVKDEGPSAQSFDDNEELVKDEGPSAQSFDDNEELVKDEGPPAQSFDEDEELVKDEGPPAQSFVKDEELVKDEVPPAQPFDEDEKLVKDEDHGQQDTSSEKIDAPFNCQGPSVQSFDEDEELVKDEDYGQQDASCENNQAHLNSSDIRKENNSSEYNQRHFNSSGDEEWMSFLCSGNKKVAKGLLESGHLPNQGILEDICQLFGRKSKVTLSVCNAICEHIKSKDEHIVDVYAAYKLQNTDKITFVVSVRERENNGKETKAKRTCLKEMINYSFMKRIVGVYDYESTEIMNNDETSGDDTDKEAHCKVRDCVSKYSVELMTEHKYLSVVSACSKKSIGYHASSWKLKSTNCIVLYVHTKHYIPINEEPFKTHYDGILVDVREGAFIPFGRTAGDYFEHVQMGCEIRGEERSGTLGCFLDHPQYGVCGVTCAHVILESCHFNHLQKMDKGVLKWPLHDMCKKVYQPASQQSSIGHTVQLIFNEGSENSSGMEIALFKLTTRLPKTSDFPDASNIGSSAAGNINYEHWRICGTDRLNSKMMRVVKFGSKTELRYGNIIFDKMAVKELDLYPLSYEYFDIKLHKQIEIVPENLSFAFAEAGDSGALVFLVADNGSDHTCIGIVEGGTTYGTVVVTPIVPILEELNVSSLKSFDTENTISEIHDRIDNLGIEVKGEMQTVKNEMLEAMDKSSQQVQKMLNSYLTPPNIQQRVPDSEKDAPDSEKDSV